jgi:hypothetical protein
MDDKSRLSLMPRIAEEETAVERPLSTLSSNPSTFEAFTWKWLNPRWFAAIECAVTVVLVSAALIINIVQAV